MNCFLHVEGGGSSECSCMATPGICFKGVHVCVHVAARNAAWAAELNRLHGATSRKTCAVTEFEWHSREVACDAALSNLRETHQIRLVFARWRRRTGRRHEKQTSGNTEWRRRDCETPCSFVEIVKSKIWSCFSVSHYLQIFLRFCKKNYCNTLVVFCRDLVSVEVSNSGSYTTCLYLICKKTNLCSKKGHYCTSLLRGGHWYEWNAKLQHNVAL